MIRRALRRFLEQKADWSICGEGANGREGIDKALQLCPDLILLDLSMPEMNGFQAARELHRLLPAVPILMFTTFNNAQLEQEALSLGVAAVTSKSDGIESLYQSIHDLLSTT